MTATKPISTPSILRAYNVPGAVPSPFFLEEPLCEAGAFLVFM